MKKNTRKIVRWPLLLVCIAGIFAGVYLIMTPPVTRIYSERIAICDNGICDISSRQVYSDGSAAGSSSNGIPESWVTEWMKSK